MKERERERVAEKTEREERVWQREGERERENSSTLVRMRACAHEDEHKLNLLAMVQRHEFFFFVRQRSDSRQLVSAGKFWTSEQG